MVQLTPVLSARALCVHRMSQPLPAQSEHITFGEFLDTLQGIKVSIKLNEKKK